MQFNLENYHSVSTMGVVSSQTRQHCFISRRSPHHWCFLPLCPDYIVEKQLTYGLLQKLLSCMLFSEGEKKARVSAVFISMKYAACWWYGWRKTWHDLHARVSKKCCSLLWIKRVTFKNRGGGDASLIYVWASSYRPSALIPPQQCIQHGLPAKT